VIVLIALGRKFANYKLRHIKLKHFLSR